MDPDLIKAIRDIRKAKQRAQEANVAFTPADEENLYRKLTGGRFGLEDAQRLIATIDTDVNVRNVLRSAVQGGLLNWADEGLGMLPEFLGGGDAAQEEMRLREALFREQHPVADMVGGVLGGALVPGTLAAGAVARPAAPGTPPGPPRMSVPRAAGAGLLIGAASGASAGLGAGEGLQDRIDRGIEGALMGSGVGLVAPALGHGLRRLTAAAKAQRRFHRAVEASGGPEAAEARLGEFAEAGRGGQVRAADLSGPLQQELEFAATNHPYVFTNVADALERRQRGMAGRLLEDTRGLLDVPSDARRLQRQLEDMRSGLFDPEYERLRAENAELPVTPAIADQVRKPVVQRALDRAKEHGLIAEPPDAANLSFNHLLDVRKSLRSARSRAFKEGDGTLGHALRDTQQALESGMEEMVPDWRAVNAGYARWSRFIDRLLEGEKQWRIDDTRELNALVERLKVEAPGELFTLRAGMASRLVARLRSQKVNRSEADNIVNGGEAMNDKLRVIFGSEETFQKFMQRATIERDMRRTSAAVTGAQTARRMAQAGPDAVDVGQAALGGIPGLVASAPSWLARAARPARNRAESEALAPLLMTQGVDNIRRLLWQDRLEPVFAGATSVARVPAAASSLFDNF